MTKKAIKLRMLLYVRPVLPRLFVVLASLLADISALSQTYNAEKDFSITQGNPNGVWSYTWSSSLDSTQTLYSITQTNVNGGTVQAWCYSTGGTPIPLVEENATASTQLGVLPPETLAFHPGYQSQFSHVVWNAPANGSCAVSAPFFSLGGGNTEVYVVFRSGGTSNQLWSGNIVGATTNLSFTTNLTVNAGDQIDFSVGVGGDSPNDDTTGLAPQINFTGTPSQPPQFAAIPITGVPNGLPVLHFSGTAGNTYHVWTTTNLARMPVDTTWTLLGTGTFSGADTFTCPAPGTAAEFYILTEP
jgi:hypothetical protein